MPSEPITDAELSEWEIEAERATQGPWDCQTTRYDTIDDVCAAMSRTAKKREGEEGSTHLSFVYGEHVNTAVTGNGPRARANAAHIANARPENWLRLIAALREARALRQGTLSSLSDSVRREGALATRATHQAAEIARKDAALREIVRVNAKPPMTSGRRRDRVERLACAALAPKENPDA